MEVRVEISVESSDICDAIKRSIEVDNIDLPKCIDNLSVRCEGNILKIIVNSTILESIDILRIWSTLDDIVRCIRASLTALKGMEKKRI